MNRIQHNVLKLTCCLMLAITVSGCSPQNKHRMLNIFFTGVPPLDEQAAAEEVKNAQKPDRQIAQMTPLLYSHPLWEKGICDPCHLTNADFTIPGVVSRSNVEFKSGGGIPGKLVRPQNMLCLKCHKDKSPLRALNDNLWLHNTTAKGDCLECHDPHQSKNPHVLKRDLSRICLPCHEKGDYLQTAPHQQGKPCMDCHNPHMGKNRNLLSAEFKETKIPVTELFGSSEFNR